MTYGMPPGTQPCYLTPDGVVVVLGTPDGEHNCDAMGCGSVSDHVIERINVRELRERNGLLITESETLRSALRTMVFAVESEAREAQHALTAADELWNEMEKP